jgi:hypothetical protein
VKKEKQLTGRKLCSFFAKPQKQICPPYFSSNTKVRLNCVFFNIIQADVAIQWRRLFFARICRITENFGERRIEQSSGVFLSEPEFLSKSEFAGLQDYRIACVTLTKTRILKN